MTTEERVAALIKAGQARGFWRLGVGLPHHARQIYGSLSFEGKRVLEIGCGRGVFCFWAAIHGASRVLGLEPMAAGFYDAKNYMEEFRKIARELQLKEIDIEPTLIQDFRPPENSFDIVLSLSSLNHFHEEECIHLHQSPEARRLYTDLFRNVRRMMPKGGTLILTDCDKHSLWSDVGLKNPFNPYIEWHKHQKPQLWIDILSDAGFGEAKLQHPCSLYGRYLGITYVPGFVSYLLGNVFRIEMTAV
jgi:SAM-dependent methyltransferase